MRAYVFRCSPNNGHRQVSCQEETSHAWLDYGCVATVKVLRDVLTGTDRDKRKLLKIADG